ncbi:MAG: SprT family zinc-dependent metalloprotease [Methylovulum sp.]|nr:SprT family zinc-dependent metalloprotease [Methylovulum sp.]
MPNLPFPYTIRRSPRSVKVKIVVTFDKVEVIAPTKVAEQTIVRFVHEKQHWVMSALTKVAEKNQHDTTFAPVFYGDGTKIPYRGEFYKLTVKPSPLKRLKITLADGLVAHIPKVLPVNAHNDAIKIALVNWLKSQAKQHVQDLVKQHAPRKQLTPRSIMIKRQKSRWGSCGIHNDISINWLLILAPPEILEYVVVHELCHIQVRNHSAHFWALVAEHLPDYQQHRRWLKQQGASLMRGLD